MSQATEMHGMLHEFLKRLLIRYVIKSAKIEDGALIVEMPDGTPEAPSTITVTPDVWDFKFGNAYIVPPMLGGDDEATAYALLIGIMRHLRPEQSRRLAHMIVSRYGKSKSK